MVSSCLDEGRNEREGRQEGERKVMEVLIEGLRYGSGGPVLSLAQRTAALPWEK